MSKSILITAALLSGLQWMIEDAVEISYERVANGGMEPEDRLLEVQEIDMAIDFLAEAGADDAIVTRLRGAYVNQEIRDDIERELTAKEDAARALRPKFRIGEEAYTFTGLSDALEATLVVETGTEALYNYESQPVFNNGRDLIGYQMRVKNVEGFGVGWIIPGE